ncbi:MULTISPECIES: EamA family transporter [Rhizobium/Agrobacterium group]|uniref:EamA family transporter n=1 Tax=Rhizobium/Agrobacterium group TaxID=227290 RepID=UPI000B3FC115|nr:MULTISPECIES: EamA family transporter [Rhizobium/Agrobacterium group]MCF1485437.1 EamA family transporter [Allorhizobium ampelinum]NSZ45648.1 EamA family transporter [Agrobacterium vitis]NTA29757.1 EamA family transporter [Allorhizobium ampelinum]OVE88294.1 EamA family transporter [Allorhizobium ampelinum]
MDNKSRQRFDLLITALVPLVWGSTYLVTTQFLPPGIPLTAAVLRALPAGLILVLLQRKMLQGHWWWRAALLGVLNIGAFFYFLFLAAYHLPGGIAALLMSIQPVIVLIYSAILFRNPVRATQFLACLCAALGVALVALRSDVMLNTQGVTAGLAGAFSMATGMVLAKKFSRPDNMSLLALTGWQLTFGGLALVPFALMTESFPETLTLRNIGGLSYLSMLGALVTYALWFRGIARLPALTVSFLSLLSPLTAAILGAIFLGQTLTWIQFGGGMLVLVSVYLSQPQVSFFGLGSAFRKQLSSKPAQGG